MKSFTTQDPNQDQKELLKKVVCKVIDNDSSSFCIIANDKGIDLCIYNGDAVKMIKSVLAIYGTCDPQMREEIIKGMTNTQAICNEVLNILGKS